MRSLNPQSTVEQGNGRLELKMKYAIRIKLSRNSQVKYEKIQKDLMLPYINQSIKPHIVDKNLSPLQLLSRGQGTNSDGKVSRTMQTKDDSDKAYRGEVEYLNKRLIKQRRRQAIIQNYSSCKGNLAKSNPQTNESQTSQEYDKQALPGPGSYKYVSDFDRACISPSNSSFMSKSTRFPSIVQRNNPLPATDKGKQSVNERGLCISEEKEAKTPPKNKKRIKSIKRIPFNALANRVMTISQEEMPGPLDYYPRLGIEEDLIRRLQRNLKASFGSLQNRFSNSRVTIERNLESAGMLSDSSVRVVKPSYPFQKVFKVD